MKPNFLSFIRRLLTLWVLSTSLVAPAALAQNKVVKFVEGSTGAVGAYRQKVAGIDEGPQSWEPLSTTAGLNLVASGAPLAKPISRAFPQVNATLNFRMYPDVATWKDGFIPTTFYSRTDVELPEQWRYSRLLANKAYTAPQMGTQAVRNHLYFEVSGGMLGPYEHAPTFVDASFSTVLNHIAANADGNAFGAKRICFNFEHTYMPVNIASWDNPTDWFEAKGVVQHWPNADNMSWVCEQEELKGQTKTLRWLFDNGKLNAEVAQRLVNRHTAILLFYKTKAPNALVSLGDGSQVYMNASVAFIDKYASLKAANDVRGYTPAFWTTPANFDTTATFGGITLKHKNKTLWQHQDWLNNYCYVGEGLMTEADYDATKAAKTDYPTFWSRVRPAVSSDDVNIPASFALNRAKLIQYGRPDLPISWQGHIRFEFGIKRMNSGQTVESFFNQLGPDGPIMPDWALETYAVVTRMIAQKPGDGITMWCTIGQGGPGLSEYFNSWSDRPLWDRMGFFAGLAAQKKFDEYFDPAKSPKVFGIDDMYVRYDNGITGGNWSGGAYQAGVWEPIIVDGGDGFYKRSANLVVHHQAPSWVDVRSKCGVMARVITKRGVKWALISITNHRQAKDQTSYLSVRFKAADVGTGSDLTVTGLSCYGWRPTLLEVCLQPNLLTIPQITAVGSGTGTSPGSGTSTNPGSGTTTTNYTINRVLFFGNSITAHGPAPDIGWTLNNGMAASAPDKDYVRLVMARVKQSYPQAEHTIAISGDFERTFRTYNPAGDAILNAGLSSPTNLIILRFGENIDDNDVWDGVFKQKLEALIDYCRAKAPPGTPVLLSTTCWEQTASTAIIRQVATAKSCRLIDLKDMWNTPGYYAFGQYSNPAVAKHPNDAGMAEIAKRVIAQIPGFGSTTTTTGDPFMGFSWTPVPASSRPADGKIILANNRIKVTQDLNYGGAITGVQEYGGPNMVNNYDHGRQLTVTMTTGPYPFTPNQTLYPKAPGTFAGFGYNPIWTGSWVNQSSRIITYGFESATGTHYVEAQMRNFPTANFETGANLKAWSRLINENTVRYWIEINLNRNFDSEKVLDGSGNLARFPGDGQEFPILYGNYKEVWKVVYPVENGTQEKNLRVLDDHKQSIPLGAPWLAMVGGNGRGLGWSGPGIGVATWRVDGDINNHGSGETSYTSSYFSNPFLRNIDPVGRTRLMFDVTVGTPADIALAAAVHTTFNPANNKPNYNFSNARHDFVAFNALLNDEGTAGELVIDHLDQNPQLHSPYKSFNAADAPTLYLKIKNESPETQLLLQWIKPGQTDRDRYDFSTGQGQEFSFSVPNDGLYHTVPLNMAGRWRWDGKISRLTVKLVNARENTPTSGRKWRVKYFGINNPN